MHTKFWFKGLEIRGYLRNLNVDGRIILKWILNGEGVNWIQLVQDSAQ
jgi:hypothetical protein